MLNGTEVLMYLWLFPVVIFIVIPLLLLPFGLLRDFFPTVKKRSAAVQVAQVDNHQSNIDAERRRYPRIEPKGVVAHISDGNNCCQGEVRDISQPGICLVSPTNILDKGAENLGVLVTEGEDRIQLLIKPKWKRHKGEQHHIGGVVAENLESWKEFTLRLECA